MGTEAGLIQTDVRPPPFVAIPDLSSPPYLSCRKVGLSKFTLGPNSLVPVLLSDLRFGSRGSFPLLVFPKV